MDFPSNGNSINSPNSDEAAEMRDTVPDNSAVPKPKRLACMICRKRKLKCDGLRPSCSTCSRLGHSCAYDEQRRKSGPKRGYVKALEERLKQVETLLKTQDTVPPAPQQQQQQQQQSSNVSVNMNNATAAAPVTLSMGGSSLHMNSDTERWNLNDESPSQIGGGGLDDFNNFGTNMGGMPMNNVGTNFTWEMIGLGLEEPLPPQDKIDELHQIYFEKVHPSIPMIHRYRYLAAMNLAPHQRPPVCLRYAMWTMACSITDKFGDLKHLFYQRARKYVEGDYVKGYGEHMISVAHCQTHILLASYEIKMMYFPRAWINIGSAVRLAQMIGLHRLDGSGLDVKQCLQPPKDWTEREERRRTFWMAFCEDRYASIGTGWPMTVDERDIMTRLPSTEEAFDMSRPEQTQTLEEAASPGGAAKLSSFGGIVLMASLFGRNLVHLHRPDADDQDHDVNGPFWKRHRQMDSILLNTSLGLPSHLKLPSGLSNPNIVFMNMSIHTSTICLHQAAIFKAEKNKLAASVSSESKVRCITAAGEIASIMRTISHMDLSAMNPFISFCLYVSARVFVQYLKSRPDDDQTIDSLRFLLSAMNALKRRNPLTESFLVQLDVDFEALAQKIPKLRNAFQHPDSPSNTRSGSPPVCSNPEEVKGILAYRECRYEDGEPSNASEMMDGQSDGTGVPVPTYGSQQWLSAQTAKGAVLTPNSAGYYDNGNANARVMAYGDSDKDASGSPEGLSNGQTPNSSSSGGESRQNMSAMGMNGNGMRQNVMHRGGNGTGLGPGPGADFFSIPTTGFIPHSLPQQPGGFAMSSGFTPMGVQEAIEQPGGEDMLKVILNMGPMDAMDLSSWGSAHGHEAMKG